MTIFTQVHALTPSPDRRPEVSPAYEPGANISEGISEMGPDQFHQYPCAGTAHRMKLPPPAYPGT